MAETETLRPDVEALNSAFPSDVVFHKVKLGEQYVGVKAEQIVEVVTYLRDNQGYDYFVECVGIDYSTYKHPRDFDERFEVVYNLFSVKKNLRLFVKVAVEDGVKIPTLKHVFLGAEYPEREIQDLYGVFFAGNEPKDNERFLLPDDWSGFPLRKEVPLGGEDVVFFDGMTGPAVEDLQSPHAGESWHGKTGSGDISGR